jgi:glycosyltransferase involved in cell wall biosynthesis
VKQVEPSAEIEVASTSFGMTPEWQGTLRASLPEDVRLRMFPARGNRTWHLSPQLWRWTWKAVPHYDVLHIHAAFNPISTGCAWIARRRRKPYILRPLGTLSPYTFSHGKASLKRLYYALFESRTASGAAALHFTAAQEKEKALRLGLRPKAKVIPLPYDGPVRSFKRDERQPVFLFLGRLDPVKGLELLLQAFAIVQKKRPDARLVIAGGGDVKYEAHLQGLAKELGLLQSVEFAGYVEGEKKEYLLATATAFVMPSYQENFGMAAVEAMAAGLPVIVTRGVDLWPDVESYRAGIVVEHELEPLASAMLRLLEDQCLRSSMGQNGVTLVREEYHPRVIGRALLDMYREAINTE